ncbi:glycosyltransferase family 4 protein [Sphingomonas sp.]|uniref:glycosyltransferase family 4 protein n=1 Tax=Sphingomonas sp. TaxID=28214 RepID=UPI000DB23E4B|nr:glycosyltransferase family 4 protein [Sphingomonas sp.]PZU07035.1 MAG: glycosyl transferase family 1 [Sphingomonas sp.]
MRILHLGTLYPPHIVGGAERSVELLAEAQAALGHQVGAACLNREAVAPVERNGVTVYRMEHGNSFWMEDADQHSRVERTVAKLKQPFNSFLAHQFGAVLDQFKPDLLHSHSMVEVSSLLWSEAARRNIAVAHTIRDYELLCTNSGMFKNGKPCAKRHVKCQVLTLDKLLRHRAIGAVAGVGRQILQTHVDEGYFSHVAPAYRRVIWNPAIVKGADPDYVKPRLDGPIRFGYLGRISAEKGVDTMLNALRRLEPGSWEAIIAGKAPSDMAKFEALAAGMPVNFAGFMDPKAFFEAIDILIVPSLWAEPLPRTILEASAMRVPSLGARSGGIPELIGDDNKDWLFDAGDDVDLADRMAALIARGRDDMAFGRFGDILAETQPQTVAAKYLDLYEGALAGHRAKAAALS